MNKKLLTLTLAAAVLAMHMPAAEAVNLGSIGNIGNTRTYNRSYNRTTTTNNILNQAINKAVKSGQQKRSITKFTSNCS